MKNGEKVEKGGQGGIGIRIMAAPFGPVSPDRLGGDEFSLYDAEVLVEKGKTHRPPAVGLHEERAHDLG